MSLSMIPGFRAVTPRRARLLLVLPLLCTSLASSACEKTATASSSPALSASAALPTRFSPDTKLILGDPLVQRQLAVVGELDKLPFVIAWQNLTGGPQTIEAFRAQALEGGSVGDTPPIHARFTGVDVKIIAVQVRSKPAMSFATAPGSNVRSLEQLRGKKLAYSPGQAQGALVLRALKKAALRTSDVTLVELTSAEFKDALANRQVDVAPLSGPILQRYLKEYGAAGAAVFEHGCRDSLAFYYVPTRVLQDPDKAGALRAYVELRTRSQLWAYQHPDAWIAAYYVKDQGLTVEQGKYIVEHIGRPEYPSDWSEAIALTQETIDALAEVSHKPRFDAHELFDLRFQNVAADVARAGATAQHTAGRENQP
jgi:sulfonate transport system substrate-binding protein